MLTLIIILLLLGILLLMAEAFIPGGIVGSLGVIVMLISGFLFAREYGWGLGGVYFGVGAVVGFCAWLFTFLYFAKRISLSPIKAGGSGELDSLVGLRGMVVQSLRPSGTIIIGDRRYSARTEGSTAEVGQGLEVKVVGVDSTFLVVEPVGEG